MIRRLLLITQFELQRLFTTKKGLLYLITFAVVWLLILFYPIRIAAEFFSQTNPTHGNLFFEFIGMGSLMNWQVAEFGVYWCFTLFLFPMLSIMIAADQTSSDRERGTLRFLTLRTSRDSLFFGRFTAVMFIQAVMIIITLATTFLLSLYRDSSVFLTSFNSVIAISVNMLIILLPFTALMAALSAAFNSARQSTMWAVLILVFSAGIINLLSSYLPVLDMLKIFVPGYYSDELTHLAEWEPLQLAYVSLLQTVIFLALGRWIMMRQSL